MTAWAPQVFTPHPAHPRILFARVAARSAAFEPTSAAGGSPVLVGSAAGHDRARVALGARGELLERLGNVMAGREAEAVPELVGTFTELKRGGSPPSSPGRSRGAAAGGHPAAVGAGPDGRGRGGVRPGGLGVPPPPAPGRLRRRAVVRFHRHRRAPRRGGGDPARGVGGTGTRSDPPQLVRPRGPAAGPGRGRPAAAAGRVRPGARSDGDRLRPARPGQSRLCRRVPAPAQRHRPGVRGALRALGRRTRPQLPGGEGRVRGAHGPVEHGDGGRAPGLAAVAGRHPARVRGPARAVGLPPAGQPATVGRTSRRGARSRGRGRGRGRDGPARLPRPARGPRRARPARCALRAHRAGRGPGRHHLRARPRGGVRVVRVLAPGALPLPSGGGAGHPHPFG